MHPLTWSSRAALPLLAVAIALVAGISVLAWRGDGESGAPADRSPAHSAVSSGFLDRPLWWPARGALIVQAQRGLELWKDNVATVSLEGLADGDVAAVENVALPATTCDRFPQSLVQPFAARPLGRQLAYIENCYGPDAYPPEASRVMVLDPATGTAEPYRPYGFAQNTGPMALSPDGKRAIVNDNNGLRAALHWLAAQGLKRVPLPIDNVNGPDWSPDGEWIAFTGPMEGTNDVQGLARVDLSNALYLLSADGAKLRVLADGLGPDAGDPAWSPDGRWLALVFGPENEQGVWLVEVATGKLHLVFSGRDLSFLTWLPDGRTLVVAVGALKALDYWDFEGNVTGTVEGDVGLYVIPLPDLDALE